MFSMCLKYASMHPGTVGKQSMITTFNMLLQLTTCIVSIKLAQRTADLSIAYRRSKFERVCNCEGGRCYLFILPPRKRSFCDRFVSKNESCRCSIWPKRPHSGLKIIILDFFTAALYFREQATLKYISTLIYKEALRKFFRRNDPPVLIINVVK